MCIRDSDGLHGHEVQVADGLALLVAHLHVARGLALVHPCIQALGGLELEGELLVALGVLLKARQGLLDGAQVCQHELGADGLEVAFGVCAALAAHDVWVLEVAHDLADGVALADVCQELVAQDASLKSARVVPCRVSSTTTINNYQPLPLGGSEGSKIVKDVNKRSAALKGTGAKFATKLDDEGFATVAS